MKFQLEIQSMLYPVPTIVAETETQEQAENIAWAIKAQVYRIIQVNK